MAEDVIPARGNAAAEPVPGADPVPAPARKQATPSRSERARSSAYRARFVLVYFGLALVFGGAVGGLVVALGSSSPKHLKRATVFSPAASGEIGAIDLASNVQSVYRLPNGLPLVDIVASRNSLQDGNGGLIRVRFQIVEASDAQRSKDSRTLIPNDAIQFSLCGSNADCAIPGSATRARGALLRREGLELALRTFQRDAQVDNVAVFMRPFAAPQGWEGVALMFDRDTVLQNNPGLLTRPLTTTLPRAGKPITTAQMTPHEISRINELTQPYLFVYRYQILGGRDALLQLEPPS